MQRIFSRALGSKKGGISGSVLRLGVTGIFPPAAHPRLEQRATCDVWTKHSERNWMTSMLAAIEVERAEREYVGRWGVSSADEYLRTAQRVIFGLRPSSWPAR